jgi:hypothetical protein
MLQSSAHEQHSQQQWFEYLLSLAHQKYNAQDYDGALSLLQDLHSLNPLHVPTLLLIGCTCYSLCLFGLSIYFNNLILQQAQLLFPLILKMAQFLKVFRQLCNT